MKSNRLAIISGNSTPANILAGNDDLLTEILKRLPVISLLRFKSVSKHWLSLITDPLFSRLRNPNLDLPSGFFLPSLHSNTEFDFVPLDGENPIKSPFRKLNFAPDISGITILTSCNGLLCCGNITSPNISEFYVYNPSNQKFAMVPPPGVGARKRIIGVNLAFDPSKSPLYKVICVVLVSRPPQPRRVRFDIYSSETGNWKVSVEALNLSFRTKFRGGVYFNGAIHWFSRSLSTYYFDVDQERTQVMPMPPFTNQSQFRYSQHFGECLGHLHLIETYGRIRPQFNVFEMERDRAGWFVKYHVNLDPMVDMYPEMILDRYDPMGQLHYGCFPLYVLETESNEEDSYLVLHIPGKIMRYNLIENTFKLLLDFDPPSNVDYFLRYHSWSGAFPFIASLSCV